MSWPWKSFVFCLEGDFDFIRSADDHSPVPVNVQAPYNDMSLHPSASASIDTNFDLYPTLEPEPLEAELDILLQECSETI